MGILSVFCSVELWHIKASLTRRKLLFAVVPHIGVSRYLTRGVRHILEVTVECVLMSRLYHPGVPVTEYEATN